MKLERKNGIDLFRLIGALFVIVVHSDLGKLDPELIAFIRLMGRWAVPFYFMTSGYFLAPKLNEDGKLNISKIEGSLKLMLSIILVSSLIYLPLTISYNRFSLSIGYFWSGLYFHIWFIGSLLFGYISVWYLQSFKVKLLPIISVVILVMSVLSDSYDLIWKKDFVFGFFRYTLSIPCMYFGILVSNNKWKINYWLLGLCICLGLAIQYAESELFFYYLNYNRHLHQFLLGTVVLVIPIFILASQLKIKENIWVRWGRNHTLFIYLYHPMISKFLTKWISTLFPKFFYYYKMGSPIFILACMLGLGLLLEKFVPRVYGWLNGRIE